MILNYPHRFNFFNQFNQSKKILFTFASLLQTIAENLKT